MGTSLFDSTPAISQMMGLLSPPQQPMQPVTAQQMPQTQPNLPQAEQPKLVDRLQDRLSGLLQSVRPKAARGYEGILSSEEVESARPGIFRTLFHQPGETAEKIYRERLDNMVKMKEYASGLAQQKSVMATRQNLAKLFPAKDGETELQRDQRLEMMGAYALQNGDSETAKHIGEFLKSAGSERFQVAGGDLIDLIDPNNPKIINAGSAGQTPEQKLADQKALIEYRAKFRSTGGGSGALIATPQEDGTYVWAPKVAGQTAPGPRDARTTAIIRKDVAANSTVVEAIDEALAELDAHPDGVGLKRSAADFPVIGAAGDAYNQRKDEKGIALRALVANVSSMQVKLRSGAAVTVSEFGRLRPYIPSVSDTPAAIRIKLGKLRKFIATENSYLTGAQSPTSKGNDRESGTTGKKLDAYRHLLK
jgi:hypothetical protein